MFEKFLKSVPVRWLGKRRGTTREAYIEEVSPWTRAPLIYQLRH